MTLVARPRDFENRDLGVDLRAVADDVLHLLVDPDDADRPGLDDDQDVGVVVGRRVATSHNMVAPMQAPMVASSSHLRR